MPCVDRPGLLPAAHGRGGKAGLVLAAPRGPGTCREPVVVRAPLRCPALKTPAGSSRALTSGIARKPASRRPGGSLLECRDWSHAQGIELSEPVFQDDQAYAPAGWQVTEAYRDVAVSRLD